MTLSEKLRTLRAEKGITRKAAAEQSGMSIATYSSYEDGKRIPTRNPENYDKLAAVFGCSPEYLKDDDAPAPEAPPAPKAKRASARKRIAPAEKAEKAEKGQQIHVELQYGERAVDFQALVAKAFELDANVTDLYVKPEENMAYYVAGDQSGSFELF